MQSLMHTALVWCGQMLAIGIPWSVAGVWSTAVSHKLVPNEQTPSRCCDPLSLFGNWVFIRKHNECLEGI